MTAARLLDLSSEQRDYLGLGRRGYGAIPTCSLVEGDLDRDLLEAAVRTVVARHEPLRMRLHALDDGTLRQSFAPPDDPAVAWAESDLSEAADPLAAVLGTGVGALDLRHEEPLRLHLLRQGERRTYVLALLDHLATDGWGSYLFNWELWRGYRALRHGRPPALPELPLSYTDHLLGRHKVPPGRERLIRDHWQAVADRYADAGGGLPAAAPTQGRGRGDLVRDVLPESAARATALAEGLGLSANTVPLACLLLAAWSLGERDSVALSFIYAGRDRPATRSLVGVFHRHVPLVVDDVPAGSLADLLRKVADGVLEGVRRSRPPYSARLFSELLAERGATPGIKLLYNQVDATFGRARRGSARQLDDRSTARFVDSHFWPGRWHGYHEPTLRLVVGGGEAPTIQAIYNDGRLAETDAVALVDRMAALLRAMAPEAAERSVREFVETETVRGLPSEAPRTPVGE